MDLHQHAHDLGVTVRYTDQLDRWGRYDHSAATITLLAGMGAIQERSTYAHELGHAHWQHETDCPKSERQADEYAARLLIPPPDWAWATNHADSLSGLAAELGVLPRLVWVAHTIYQDYTPCEAW